MMNNQISNERSDGCESRPLSSISTGAGPVPPPPQSPTSLYNNSLAIRQEIQRFESVHPSIYAIYDLLDLIGGADGRLVAQHIREHVVCIEDSFVNSQEWTLSRTVPDLRLGVVGTITSGKSALVHRYLTGSYLQDESPEGGRFKKEVTVDGNSYLLLIRDEGGPPEMQLSCWVDAVLFVFSVDNEHSFNSIYSYYSKMFHLRSNHDIPVFLIATTDSVSESNPRVIDECRGRKLAAEMKRCSYYETCATYGQNVDKVFHEACSKIVMSRNVSIDNFQAVSRPTTPSYTGLYRNLNQTNTSASTPLSNITNSKFRHTKSSPPPPMTSCVTGVTDSEIRNSKPITDTDQQSTRGSVFTTPTLNKPAIAAKPKIANPPTPTTTSVKKSNFGILKSSSLKFPNDSTQFKTPVQEPPMKESKASEPIVQTPNSSRKNRRKSNLFTPLSSKSKNTEEKYKTAEVGVGRTIPIKQGYLYKKSKKTLNKDWKKKYVTLTTEGCLTYHPTLHDYMDDVHGKNIPLKHTTVKIPGQKPRCGRASIVHSPNSFDSVDLSANSYEPRMIPNTNPKYDTHNGKKRSRRLMNKGMKNGETGEDSDGNEFVIVSLDNKQWHFNATKAEDREEWICAIEQQILSSLQNSECDKTKLHNVNSASDSTISSIRTVPGNKYCVDCDAPNPDWASLNLGALICIECSGIHRKLGTHISKVRSLGLDVWPPSHVSVMLGLGNTAANQIWEHSLNGKTKPTPTSSYEEKERFIRAKYEAKEFLAPLKDGDTPLEQQIIETITQMNIKQLAHVLAHMSRQNLSFGNSNREKTKTPLHLAASKGCLEICQLLLWYNADEKAVDLEGKTALYYARIFGHKEIEELLIQSGCSAAQDDNHIKCLPQSSNDKFAKHRESIPLNFKSVEMFNKLPASII